MPERSRIRSTGGEVVLASSMTTLWGEIMHFNIFGILMAILPVQVWNMHQSLGEPIWCEMAFIYDDCILFYLVMSANLSGLLCVGVTTITVVLCS
jgi:hypothetical protein